MVQLTEKAIGKVKEIMSSQEPAPAGLRIAVVGGGCSGFSYSMAFENQPNMLDKTYTALTVSAASPCRPAVSPRLGSPPTQSAASCATPRGR